MRSQLFFLELFCLGTEGESAELVLVIGLATRETDRGISTFLLALLPAAEVVLTMMECFDVWLCGYEWFGCMYDLYGRLLIRVIRLHFDDGHQMP